MSLGGNYKSYDVQRRLYIGKKKVNRISYAVERVFIAGNKKCLQRLSPFSVSFRNLKQKLLRLRPKERQ